MARTQPPRDDLPCIELVELVTDYLEGVLDQGAVDRVTLHLAGCDGCAAYVDQVRMIVATAPGARSGGPVRVELERLLATFRSTRGSPGD